MSDTELLKRLAEREGRLEGEEGIDKDWFFSGGTLHRNVDPPIGTIRQTHWNPLRHWSDCGPLIEKYKIDVDWCPSDTDVDDVERGLYWQAEIWDYSDPNNYIHLCERSDPDLRRAICLAVDAMEGEQ